MNPLRIAVALADGWKITQKDDPVYRNKFLYELRNRKGRLVSQTVTRGGGGEWGPDGWESQGTWEDTTFEFTDYREITKVLPNYEEDRNAIIGAIERMSEEEKRSLAKTLCHTELVPAELALGILLTPPEKLCRLYLEAKGIEFNE